MKKEHSGKFLFWFINFSYTIIGFSLYLIFTMFISLLISESFLGVNPINSENDWIAIYTGIYLLIIYFLIKFTIFPILYIREKQFPYIYSFFNKFRNNTKFMWKVLSISFLIDSIWIFLFIKEWSFAILFLWLSPIYLTFLIFFPPIKKNNISEKGLISVHQGKSQRILMIIFFSFIILFFLLITILFLFLILSYKLK